MTRLSILFVLALAACGGDRLDPPVETDASAPDAAPDAPPVEPDAATEADSQPGCTGPIVVTVQSVSPYAATEPWSVVLRMPTEQTTGPCTAEAGATCLVATTVSVSVPAGAAGPWVYVHDSAGLPITDGTAAMLSPQGCGVQSETLPGSAPQHEGESFTVTYDVAEG